MVPGILPGFGHFTIEFVFINHFLYPDFAQVWVFLWTETKRDLEYIIFVIRNNSFHNRCCFLKVSRISRDFFCGFARKPNVRRIYKINSNNA